MSPTTLSGSRRNHTAAGRAPPCHRLLPAEPRSTGGQYGSHWIRTLVPIPAIPTPEPRQRLGTRLSGLWPGLSSFAGQLASVPTKAAQGWTVAELMGPVGRPILRPIPSWQPREEQTS